MPFLPRMAVAVVRPICRSARSCAASRPASTVTSRGVIHVLRLKYGSSGSSPFSIPHEITKSYVSSHTVSMVRFCHFAAIRETFAATSRMAGPVMPEGSETYSTGSSFTMSRSMAFIMPTQAGLGRLLAIWVRSSLVSTTASLPPIWLARRSQEPPPPPANCAAASS